MANYSKTWGTTADWLNWTPVSSGTGNTCQRSASGGHADAACINNGTTGKNHTGAGYFYVSGTWESLFGVPAGMKVTNILVSGDGYWGACPTYTTGAASTDGPLDIATTQTGAAFLTLVAGTAYSGTFAYAHRTPGSTNQAIPSGQQASNTTVYLRLKGAVNTGNSTSASNQLFQDDLTITVVAVWPTLNCALSATEAADTMASAVHVTVRAALGATEAADVLAGTMSVRVSASLGASESPDVASVQAKVKIAASLAASESPDSFTGAVKASVAGVLGASELPDVMASTARAALSTLLEASESSDVMAMDMTVGGGLTAIHLAMATTEAADAMAMNMYVSGAEHGPGLEMLYRRHRAHGVSVSRVAGKVVQGKRGRKG